MSFWQEIMFFAFNSQNFQKILPNLNIWKKNKNLFLQLCLNMIFKQF